MDFRLIQDAERQMLRDGKSAAAIDAMKSAYRKQMFNPDGYSQTAGLGSFASGGEAYGPPPVSGPVPQGIASFQEGGEAESFFSRFNPLTGSYRKKKPLSVRAAETAIDFTPVAAVKTGQEIYDESQSEDPSLLKMGIMAAGEAAGLIPFAGPAVKTMVRRVPADLADEIAGLNRRSVDTEINNYRLNLERNTDLSPDEIDVRVENYAANQEGAVSGAVRELTDTEKLADEIAADLRSGNTDLVTDERLDELDFLGEIRLRQHYIEGNVGVDADGVPITLENAEREARMLAQGYERVGVHGTMPTQEGVSVDDIRVMRPSSYGKSGRGVYLDVEPTGMDFGDGEIVNPSGVPYPTANRFAGYNPDPRSIDRGKGAADRIPEGSQMYPLVQRGPFAKSTDYTAARRELLKQNPDLDTVELDRMANQRLMDQGFAGVDSTHYGEITSFEGGNLRAPTAVFDPRLTNLKNIGMADGGAVMNGIGTLNETARNMTRGPRGIGAYQQFADGGPPSNVQPPFSSDFVHDEEKYFEINSYDINGDTQNAIDFKDGVRLFMPDVENMIRGNRTAKEPLIGRETGKEVLDFLQKNNPTSQEFIDYFSSARLSGGGEAYQRFADGGSVPRETMIGNQPHMLAYINPEEAQLLKDLGGTGEPGPGGIPAYRPSDFAAERTGTGSYSNTSSSASNTSSSAAAANEAAAASMLSAGVGNVGGSTTYSDPFPNSNQSDDGPGYSTPAPVVQPEPEPEPQGTLSTLYDKTKDFFNPNSQAIAAMRGSGIMGNPDDPRNQGLTMFPGPISLGLKGLAYLGGIRKTDPIVKVTDDKNVYQTGSGSFYIINSVTGLPMMVESPDDLSLSSDARARMDAMMTDMNKSDNDSGPGSCGPGYVYDHSAGACVPMIGTAATSASDALGTPQYADDFTPAGGNTVVPDPVYLPNLSDYPIVDDFGGDKTLFPNLVSQQSFGNNFGYLPVGMAEGGIVNVSGLRQAGQTIDPNSVMPAMGGLAQIGMGFPGGPPMHGNDFGGGYAAMPSQMPSILPELPSILPEYKQRFGNLMNSNPLQQYGGYLEQQYGDPGFDQKKAQFLQEIQQKEQQTFGGGLLQPSNFQPGFMGGGPTAVNPTPTAFPAAFPMPGSNLFSYANIPGADLLLQGFAEGGEVEEPLSEYQRALIASESSGRSNVVNERGYKGLTQAGDAAISDFKDQEGLNFSDEEYLNSPALQMQFQRWYEQKTINYVMDKGLDAYIGKVIKGVPITMSSLLGMAHIGGDFGMQQFLETGGRYDPNDGKTSLSDYGRKFANMAVYGESGGAGFNPVTPEETLMSMPVEQEGSLQFYRPKARPPEIEFSAPATSLRPMARPEELVEPELEEMDVSLQPRRQELMEKYSLANMAAALTQQEPVGIMSATR